MIRRHVAIDLGASAGRVAVGTIQNGKLSVEVVHRFSNGPVERDGGLYWPVDQLWGEIRAGLAKASESGPVESVGVDSWGVDYALVDGDGQVLDGVRHYRDLRNEPVMRVMVEKHGDAIYGCTGIQFLPFNTLFQLVADRHARPAELARAAHILMVPDLFHYFLTGVASNEITDASTTQMLDPRECAWSREMLELAGIQKRLLPQLRAAGERLGPLKVGLARETGLAGAQIVLPGTHDTASAVAAVPAEGEGWAYVSSGTWCLVGVELPAPIINQAARDGCFTNECGANGTTRFLKNMTGLWILQECRRAWGNPEFADLYSAAATVANAPTFDPDHPRLMGAGEDMPERVRQVIQEMGATAPSDPGALTRCIFNSLAAKTGSVLEQIESITGKKIERVHVVGGGSQIDLLNQLIADLSGRIVIAGPTEATLIGNLLVQAEACGSIPNGSLREIVRRSFKTRSFTPKTATATRR